MLEILFLPFVLFASVPGGAFLPAIGLALWVRHRWPHLSGRRRMVAGTAVVAWLVYAAYETAMYFWMRTVIAPIRVDLLLIAPVLIVLTCVAVFASWRRADGPFSPSG